MPSAVIVGLGLSGLGCALELTRRKISFTAFEKEDRPGGLARTESADGFAFDHGPHILLGVPAELVDLFATLPGLELADFSAESCIAVRSGLKGVVPVPFQRNLNWLPVVERVRVLCDLACRRASGAPASYREYVIGRCGRRIFDLFLEGYESKRLRFSLDEIPPDWAKRVEAPSLPSLFAPRRLGNASGGPRTESRFKYPRFGGIEALPRAIAELLPADSLHFGSEVVEIDLRGRHVALARGGAVSYDHLALSLPLPEIVGLIKDPPSAVRQAAADLIYASVYVVGFGIDGSVPAFSFLRFPRADVPFYRLTLASAYAACNAPQGSNVVMAEMSHHSVRHPVSPLQAIDQCRKGLVRVGLLGRAQKICVERIEDIRYGHVIYNRRTEASVHLILGFLEEHSVFACGKYGRWKDMLMTQSIASGMDAARRIGALAAGGA